MIPAGHRQAIGGARPRVKERPTRKRPFNLGGGFEQCIKKPTDKPAMLVRHQHC